MKVGDVICVADFNDLRHAFVANLSWTLSQSWHNGIWALPGMLAVVLRRFSSAFCCSKLCRACSGLVTSCSDVTKFIPSPR